MIFVCYNSNVKNAKCFCERPSRPCLCIHLSITARTTHLEVNHFLVDPDSNFKNAKFFCGRPSRPCLCIRLAIMAHTTHLEGQTIPEASIPLILTIFVCYNKPFFGDPDSDVKNAKLFCGRPLRPCLCIRLAITARTTHLGGQTSPEASIPLISMIFIPTSKMPNVFVDVRQDLVYASIYPSRPVRPIWKVKRAPKRAYPSFRLFSCAIVNHFFVDPDSNFKNAKFFCGRPSRPCLCIRLAIMAHTTHLEGKTIPEASIPLILTIFVCYNKPFFGDPDSDVKNAKLFCGRPLRPCLCIRLAITARTTHLGGKMSPEASIPFISTIFVCYSKPFFGQDLVSASGWPSRPVPPIWKVKRASKRAYPSFRRFSCAIVNHFLSDPDSDVKNAKNFCGRPSRPCLCI
uniref:Uncharacterized protein n=1 Tax=Solanum lycopersicum TaxID=4081 RepID=A0A3Q7FZE8_SOLLC